MHVTPHQGCVFYARLRPEAIEQTNKSCWRDPQHDEHEDANEQQAILTECGECLRQQYDDDRSNQWSAYSVDATDHDHEQKQDRLEERKRIRADEVCDGCEDATSHARHRSRDSERGGADHDRIEADRNAGDLRIPDRSHCSAPRANTQLAEEEG